MIRIEGVSKLYRRGTREVRALDGVSLAVPRGQFAAVMGPSGSGKSTLLHLAGALDTASGGRVIVDGTDLSSADDARLTEIRRGRIGFVFQFFNLLPSLTARENVVLPALLSGTPRLEANVRADALLGRVGLAGREDHLPDEMSGGEMQRVAIARALVKDPPLLLADEPTGNLDSAAGRQILELLQSLHREGLTLLMVTHDEAAATVAQGIVRLRDGRIESDSR